MTSLTGLRFLTGHFTTLRCVLYLQLQTDLRSPKRCFRLSRVRPTATPLPSPLVVSPPFPFHQLVFIDGRLCNLGDPESTPKPLSTATYKTSTSVNGGSFPSTTKSGSGSGSTNPSDNSSSGGSKLNLPLIIGGEFCLVLFGSRFWSADPPLFFLILCEAAAGGVVVLVILVVVLVICLRRKPKTGAGAGAGHQQFPPPPLQTQEILEYQKVQPLSPMLSPVTPNLPYTTSPPPQFNMPPPVPNPPQFNPPPPVAPQFNGAYYVRDLFPFFPCKSALTVFGPPLPLSFSEP